MSHLLATVNAEAAAQADSGWQPGPVPVVEEAAPEQVAQPRSDLPLPGVGNWVVYHLRTGDSRNRRTLFPALVMATNEEAGTLMLWVVVDDGDTWMRENVRARVEPEDGWELVQPMQPMQESTVRLPGDRAWDEDWFLRKVFGNNTSPDTSIMDLVMALETRLAVLESRPRPGRPPKLKE